MFDFLKKILKKPAPEGWTDDLNIPFSNDKTLEEVVSYILDSLINETEFEKILKSLTEEFEIPEEDADFAVDRVLGGVVRAKSGSVANCPEKSQDPFAWQSFMIANNNPKIIEKLRLD